jgi:hypothetical protein
MPEIGELKITLDGGLGARGLALQLPFFEMSALRDGLVDSAPE